MKNKKMSVKTQVNAPVPKQTQALKAKLVSFQLVTAQ